jgi:Uma2 family endonuclease
MSTITSPQLPAAPPDTPIMPLSVDQYHAMIRAGILTEDHPVELLEGLLVPKMPKNSAHRRAKRMLLKAIAAILPPGWDVDTQEAMTTSDSEPEPDLYVFRARPDDYPDGHPGPQDMAMVVEVSESSLRRDRKLKKRIYARAGVREYWIVNLMDRQIEVYTDASGPADEPDYRQRQDYKPGDALPVTVDGQEVGRLPVADLLP